MVLTFLACSPYMVIGLGGGLDLLLTPGDVVGEDTGGLGFAPPLVLEPPAKDLWFVEFPGEPTLLVVGDLVPGGVESLGAEVAIKSAAPPRRAHEGLEGGEGLGLEPPAANLPPPVGLAVGLGFGAGAGAGVGEAVGVTALFAGSSRGRLLMTAERRVMSCLNVGLWSGSNTQHSRAID